MELLNYNQNLKYLNFDWANKNISPIKIDEKMSKGVQNSDRDAK